MQYRSLVLDENGSRQSVVLDAPSEQELYDLVHARGQTLLKAKPIAEEGGEATSIRRISGRKLLLFFQALESSLDAGVPLLRALDSIASQEQDEQIAALYRDLARRVEGGESLSAAFAAHPRTFDDVTIAMVEAGEQSGALPKVLEAACGYLEWRLGILGTVRTAMMYPIVVLSAGYGLVLFLLSFVVPRISGLVKKLGDDVLPLAGQLLIDASDFVAGNLIAVIGGTVAAIVLFVMALRSDTGRSILVGALSRLPVASGVVAAINRTSLCRNLNVLLEAGLSLPRSLELAANALSLQSLRDSLLAARESILGGSKICDAFDEHEVLPPVALGMVQVGEDSGRLPMSFTRLSTMYDREAKDAVTRAIGFLEPAVTVLLGLIVGGVGMLVITTVYSALGALGK